MNKHSMVAAVLAGALAAGGLSVAAVTAQTTSQQAKLSDYQKAERLAEERLRTFDELDFTVFSTQDWDRLKESHARDIVVHWPDGRSTRGIDKHLSDLKSMFTYAPDTRIKEHPIKVAQGDWTSVVGIMEGTFTRPMTMPDGTVIQPTGKPFKIRMATIGHWNAQGVMTEEYLFWDNQAFMSQLGLAN